MHDLVVMQCHTLKAKASKMYHQFDGQDRSPFENILVGEEQFLSMASAVHKDNGPYSEVGFNLDSV